MATLYGVGVGPGDPLLLTLKACQLIANSSVVSYLANEQGESQARHIAREAFAQVKIEQQHIVIPMMMSTDRTLANIAYDQGAASIEAALNSGLDVVFLCEGDPLFFGSFSYLLQRLSAQHNIQVVPGVSSVHAAAAALQIPLTIQSESFAVISGRHSDAQIKAALLSHDSLVIMKAGLARPRILALLAETGRTTEANYLEYISRDNQLINRDVEQLENCKGPYFSLFVITRARDLTSVSYP
ncbi:MAG: precorrin-2 C(20)-methyltransferase [Oceanospirillaceae bacterium]|nr:precorrin-2 C(20)-methyltransferase [Oceanospirillaceae bacterium]